MNERDGVVHACDREGSWDVKSSNSTDSEETGNNSQLTTNHETGEVAPVVSEDKLGIGLTEPVGSTLFHWKLGNDKEANLNTLKTSNDEHEEEEQEHSDGWGDGWVLDFHHGLAIEECSMVTAIQKPRMQHDIRRPQ